MRWVAAVLCLAMGCGAHGDPGPAWPKRLDPEVDGGESLAPRTASVVAASEKKDEDEDEAKPDAKTDDAAKTIELKSDDAKDTDAKPATSTDDVIIIDDIIIEIED